MSHHVIRTAEGRPRIILSGEPPYCRTLDAGPSRREDELNTGRWLVMVFAAWSMPDIRAIQDALDAVKYFDGKVHLGLRPFDAPEEHVTWCPALTDDEKTPIWLLISDGTVRLILRGLLTVNELVRKIELLVPRSGERKGCEE